MIYAPRRAKNQKPRFGSVEIDWVHPLARGLFAAWIFNEGAGGPTDLVRGTRGTLNGPTWGTTTAGIALGHVAGSSQWVDGGTAPPAMVAGPGSIVARIFPTTVGSNYFMPVSRNKGAGDNDWEIQIENTTAKVLLGGNGFEQIKSTSTLSANTLYDLAFVLGGAGVGEFFYLNGGLDNSTFVGFNWKTADGAIEFGRRAGNGFYYDGSISHVYLYSRALEAAEARALALDPYAFLRPKVARMYSWPVKLAAAAAVPAFRFIPELNAYVRRHRKEGSSPTFRMAIQDIVSSGVKFRKTLSRIGTRSGGRGTHN